jgi:site-specific DNA recombinase
MHESVPPSAQRVALYMRVSSDEQAERSTIDAQRDFLRQYTSLYQLAVADAYADDGVTGTLPLGDRPEGQRLLHDAEAGRFGCVLVYRLTRLGRSLKALTAAHDRLAQYGVTIRSATEPFDTSTSIGTFLFQLLGSMAELDRAQVLEQLTRGRDRVARNGKWTEGPVPYRYTLDASGCLTPSPRRVPPLDRTEAEVVQDLFQRMAQGSSAIGEARRFNALGIPTTRYQGIKGTARPASKRWYPVRIAQIIANPTYRGTHVYQSKYGTIERRVPPLVDTVLWEQAYAQLQRNRKLPKHPRGREYLLRGLMTCGSCGAAYVGQVVTHPSGKRDVYYRCGNRASPIHPERAARCKAKIVDATWLEDVVWSDCRTFIYNPGEALMEAHCQLVERQAQLPVFRANTPPAPDRETGRKSCPGAGVRVDAGDGNGPGPSTRAATGGPRAPPSPPAAAARPQRRRTAVGSWAPDSAPGCPTGAEEGPRGPTSAPAAGLPTAAGSGSPAPRPAAPDTRGSRSSRGPRRPRPRPPERGRSRGSPAPPTGSRPAPWGGGAP